MEHKANALHPNVPGRFEFWGEPSLLKPVDIKEVQPPSPYLFIPWDLNFMGIWCALQGTKVSLRTQGNSVFIETIAKKEESAPDYAGENMQGGWGAKVRIAAGPLSLHQRVIDLHSAGGQTDHGHEVGT